MEHGLELLKENGIDHLVRERQIIRSARTDFANKTGQSDEVLQYFICRNYYRGGVIGYDTNLQTGGRGARTLGIGMSKHVSTR